jgi:hypothetical protein
MKQVQDKKKSKSPLSTSKSSVMRNAQSEQVQKRGSDGAKGARKLSAEPAAQNTVTQQKQKQHPTKINAKPTTTQPTAITKHRVDMEELYINSHRAMPRISHIPKFGSKVETAAKVAKGAISVIPVLTPLVMIVNPAIGAGVVAVSNAIGPILSSALEKYIGATDTKNAVINSVNAAIDRFNENLEKNIAAAQIKYKEDISKALKAYKANGYEVREDQKVEFENKLKEIDRNLVSSFADCYSKGLDQMIVDIKTSTTKVLNDKGVDSSTWMKYVNIAIEAACVATKSATKDAIVSSINEAIRVEADKIELLSMAQNIVKAKDIPFNISPKDLDKESVMLSLERCTSKELTILMMIRKENELEKRDNLKTKPADRKFYEYDYLAELDINELEKMRAKKHNNKFELADGPFAEIIKTPHPKAIARMLVSHDTGDDLRSKLLHRSGVDDAVDLLDKIPHELWTGFEKIGAECNKRTHRGVLATGFVDCINKIANIFNNLVGRGIKDQELDKALDQFKEATLYKEVLTDKKKPITRGISI